MTTIEPKLINMLRQKTIKIVGLLKTRRDKESQMTADALLSALLKLPNLARYIQLVDNAQRLSRSQNRFIRTEVTILYKMAKKIVEMVNREKANDALTQIHSESANLAQSLSRIPKDRLTQKGKEYLEETKKDIDLVLNSKTLLGAANALSAVVQDAEVFMITEEDYPYAVNAMRSISVNALRIWSMASTMHKKYELVR